ncbi:MAG: DUF1573 domain-containing protein [Mariprofundaceae bacterium]|nr:DUF1573 domain-containing protein [Mariprofundaceae bacterium]
MAGKIALLCVLLLVSCAAAEAPLPAQKNLPILHLQPAVYQLGDIKEGEAATATFLMRNNSAQTMQIVDIQASCGCTIAQPESYTIAPFSFTVLQVTVDTTAKQQHIKKTVSVRDALGHESSATLQFSVVENPHLIRKGKIQGIFDGQCASCHYEPALRQTTGKGIYQAACLMCHGEKGQGAYAPKLQGYSSFKALKEVIYSGLGKPQMPAFSQAHGGPLTDVQVQTLSHWLMALPEEKVQ